MAHPTLGRRTLATKGTQERTIRYLLLLCMMSVILHVGAQEHISLASDYDRLYVGPLEPQYQLRLWHDIPYYHEKPDFYSGRVSYHGVVYDDVKLRFDQLAQRVAVLSPGSNFLCLPEQKYIDWFEMDGHRYVHDPEDSTRYAVLLCDGSTNGIRFYHSEWKIDNGDMYFGTGKLLKILRTYEHYTLITPDGEKHHVKRLSDVTKLFPEQKKQIRQTARKNHLSFSKSKREGSLVKVVSQLEIDNGKWIMDNGKLASAAEDAADNGELQEGAANNYPSSIINYPLSDKELITGIPVLDSDTLSIAVGSAKTQVYVVPGVTKARASIADDQELDEIVVVGGRPSSVDNVMMGSEMFKPQLLKNIPAAFGESDIMKIVLSLPGVTTVGEASSGYNVRGGATDQNLILFNGGTVFNPSHLFGLFTSFNSDAVEDVELFKSSVPVEYGGRISSVLKVLSKEANMQKLTGSASIGVLTSKATIEIPVVKDKVSLLLNGRTTYSDWILKQLPEKSGYKDGSANFYDLGGVLTWKPNNRNRVKVNGYWSHDKFSFSSDDNYGYQNSNISAEWRSMLSEKITATLSAGLDHYDYFNEDRATPSMAARLSFGIDQLWGKLHFRHRLTEKQVITYGLSMQHYNVQAGKYEPVGDASYVKADQLQREKALESAAYISYELPLTEKLSVSAGLRYSMFNALGPRDVNYYEEDQLPSEETLIGVRSQETGVIKTYQAPEFRLSALYAIQENVSLKVGFNTMHQYIHKVSNTSIVSPTDTWKLSDLNIKPQKGWQAAAGIYYETRDKNYELSAEVYYKHIDDYLNYRNSAVLLMNPHLETDVISTKGKAYGVELQVKKPTGKVNGWVSYTFARSLLRQDDKRVEKPLNDGDWYPSEYDRPHELKAVLNFKFTERYSLSSNFNYATGRPTTLPAGKYYNTYYQKFMPYYSDRNTYRIPDYMRLDLAFNIEPTHKLTSFLHTSFSIGVYNALARRNAYNIYYVNEGDHIKGYRLSVFGTAIPYVSLNIKFN